MISDTHRRWIIYLISCLLFTSSQFYRSSIAVISPNLITDLDLNTNDLGLLSAAFFYAFAIMQIPVGLYLDSVGPRLMMTVLSLVSVAGAVVFALGESASALIAGRLLIGAGMACNLMGPLKLVTSWFSPRYFATLAAIFFSAGSFGNIVAATPLVWFTNILGWRATFLAFAIFNLLIILLFLVIAKDRPPEASSPYHPKAVSVRFSDALNRVRQLFAKRDYWLISLGTFFRYGIYAAIQGLWAGPFLMFAAGLSQIMTGNLLLAMSIGFIIGSPVCGWISDSMLRSRKMVVIAGIVVMADTLIALAVMPAKSWLFILFALFFAFGFSSGAGQIMYAHIKERMPIENAGAAMTGINFFTMVGVAFFLHVIGRVLQEFYPEGAYTPDAFRMAFLLFGGCLVMAAVLYGFTVDDTKDNL